MREATPKLVARYIEKGYSVLLVGDHGVGKTSIVREACNILDYKYKEFNAANIDPYVDLIGVPFPQDGELNMVRKREIDEANVIFLDELNRAAPETLNATMDLVNEKMISGEKLPNLKAVVTACNPFSSDTGEYSVNELDPAQLDRFTIQLHVSNRASLAYFSKIFDKEYAKALVEWQHAIDFTRAPYVSPRRLERIGKLFLDFPEADTIEHVLGEAAEGLAISTLYMELSDALNPESEVDKKGKSAQKGKNIKVGSATETLGNMLKRAQRASV